MRLPTFPHLALAFRKARPMHRADLELLRKLPARYAYLAHEPGPKMLVHGLDHYGVQEYPGGADNPIILAWARELDRPPYTWIGDMFAKGGDAVPWCGVFVGMVAKRAGKPLPNNPISALAWADWGHGVLDRPMLGDVLTFTRNGGGHVGIYVGEDDTAYHVLGGNQSNSVNITRIAKSRFYKARRFYAVGRPANVRAIRLGADGPLSENEA